MPESRNENSQKDEEEEEEFIFKVSESDECWSTDDKC